MGTSTILDPSSMKMFDDAAKVLESPECTAERKLQILETLAMRGCSPHFIHHMLCLMLAVKGQFPPHLLNQPFSAAAVVSPSA